MLLISLFAIFSLSVLLVWVPTVWRFHRVLAVLWLIIEALLIVADLLFFNVWSVLFMLAGLYQILNLVRLLRGRMQQVYLRRATWRTALWFGIIQTVFGCLSIIMHHAGARWYAYALAIVQLIVAAALFASTQRHLQTTKTMQATTSYADRDLPSLSVLIPARNETEDLFACLSELIKSSYPKLEIIVLDDRSQNKRTPEIIRGFAHDGVRFIDGQEPGDNWLAKNYAYEQLAQAASGGYLLFCGVDVRFGRDALKELVTTMLEKHKTMLSVLPHNDRPASVLSYLVQPMRYAWELSLPRRLFNRPPVLSTCWIIKHSALSAAGGFKAVSRSIVPESYLARQAVLSDSYSFVRSNMLASSKPLSEQQATAVRMRYPQLHRRPELVFALSIIEVGTVVLPLPLAIIGVCVLRWDLAIMAGVAYILTVIVFIQVTAIMYGRAIMAALLAAPLLGLYDVLILHYSLYRYEFREVVWKARTITPSVMRFEVTPSLPELDSVQKS